MFVGGFCQEDSNLVPRETETIEVIAILEETEQILLEMKLTGGI